MTLARRMADFVSGLTLDDVPKTVREKAERCIFYGLGIGYCGLGTSFAATASAVARHAGSGRATVFHDGRKVPAGAALLANSALLHGRCQEDTCGTAHFGVAVIPALIALCEEGRGHAEDIVLALIAGYEAGGLLERGLAKSTLASGFRASPLYSAVATAAAAARLLRLDVPTTASALAHAAAFSGGTLQALSEGTDEWRYQVGLAGQAGLVAVDLALAGSHGAELAFEGSNGFARAFSGSPVDAGIADSLGKDWATLRVTFKPYPVCAHNQTPVAAAIAVHDEAGQREIGRVEIRIDPYVVPGMDETGPFSRVAETLMSTRFCVAAGLLRGKVDLAELGDFSDPAIAALIARCRLKTDPGIVFPGCRLTVEFSDGGRIVKDMPLTSADYDLGWEAIGPQLAGIARNNGLETAPLDDLAAFARIGSGLPITIVADAFARVHGKEMA